MKSTTLQIIILIVSASAVILFLTLIYLLYKRNKAQKEDLKKWKKLQHEASDLKNKLALALQAGELSVWSYLLGKDDFDLADICTIPQPGMRLQDIIDQLVEEDREKLNHFIRDIVEGKHKKGIRYLPAGNYAGKYLLV
ncbi:MAG: hypothetical protein LUH63_04840 [Parabacteroides sp.]|nr:hypothetical protein [Parabacteroides sp.]